MNQTVQANPKALIESFVRTLHPSARDDARQLMQIILDNLTTLSPGGNLLRPGGVPEGAAATPQGVSHSISGANAAYSVAISNPPTAKPGTIFHELSYSPLKSFTKDVTTLPVTTNTSLQIPAPGGTFYFRLRSSFDQKTWTPYQLSSTAPIDAGLVESSTMAAGAAFNQTNFSLVNSQTNGAITVNGTGGNFTPYTAIKGASQALRPSATVVGTQLGPTQFIGWDGSTFQTKSTLAQVLADDLEPVGQAVLGSGISGGGGATGGNGGRMTQDPNTLFGAIV